MKDTKKIIDAKLRELAKIRNLRLETSAQDPAVPTEPIPFSHNRIVFGAPGTGKSYSLEESRKKYFSAKNYRRVTFYPQYSYAQFVGSYKPVSTGEGAIR